MRRSRFPHSW